MAKTGTSFSVRIPDDVYLALLGRQEAEPELSLNVLVVRALRCVYGPEAQPIAVTYAIPEDLRK